MKIIPYLLFLFFISSCTNSTQTNTAEVTEKRDSSQPITPQETSEVPKTVNLVFGKYGCTASKFSNGTVEYLPRGFFTISQSGLYSYSGFENPSNGNFSIDKDGNLHFQGGYLDGGTAGKTDRPNKYFLVFPTIPDNRWSCGLVSQIVN